MKLNVRNKAEHIGCIFQGKKICALLIGGQRQYIAAEKCYYKHIGLCQSIPNGKYVAMFLVKVGLSTVQKSP